MAQKDIDHDSRYMKIVHVLFVYFDEISVDLELLKIISLNHSSYELNISIDTLNLKKIN
jgi:hypothetical protein